MFPVPDSEKLQLGCPGTLVVPDAVTVTVVLVSNWPDAVPAIVTSPAQTPWNVPDIDVDVWLVTVHWKFPQEDGVVPAAVCDDHVPTKALAAAGDGLVGEL